MLTVLVGPDTTLRSKKLDALLADLTKTGVTVDRYNDVRFSPETMLALAGNTSLFGGASAGVLYDIVDVAEKRDALESILEDLADSANHFIITEKAIPAAFLKKAEAVGGMVLKFENKIPKAKSFEAFNTFAITDAYCERKRALAWPLYRKAIEQGAEPRALASQIFWAIKSMILARDSKSPADSGLSPFVYQKSRAGAAHFAVGELERFADEVTVLFHESLVSGINIELALEAFILRSLEKRVIK